MEFQLSIMKPCVFCGKEFRVVGKHYAHCRQRAGRPYEHLLAQKRGKLSRNFRRSTQTVLTQSCPVCGKTFKCLDVHLRHSKNCRDPMDLSAQTVMCSSGNTEQIDPVSDPCTSNSLSFDYTLQQPLKLPASSDSDAWLSANEYFQNELVSQVIALPDSKYYVFSRGVCRYFASNFGTLEKEHHHPTRRARHDRTMKRLKDAKQQAKKTLRAARKANLEPNAIFELSQVFHLALRE